MEHLKLNNCPFCGSTADFNEEFKASQTGYVRVVCTNHHCNISTPLFYPPRQQAMHAAQKIWNRRLLRETNNHEK